MIESDTTEAIKSVLESKLGLTACHRDDAAAFYMWPCVEVSRHNGRLKEREEVRESRTNRHAQTSEMEPGRSTGSL